jgi:hypothetical protein
MSRSLCLGPLIAGKNYSKFDRHSQNGRIRLDPAPAVEFATGAHVAPGLRCAKISLNFNSDTGKDEAMLATPRKRPLAAIALLSLIAGAALGQQNQGDWNKVKKKIGAPVVVLTKSGQSFDGNLFNATDDSLKVRVQDQTQEVKRDEVAEVRVKKKGGGNKAAWIGGLALAGFGIGAVIGKVTNPDDESGLGSFGPIIGGAIGAAGGALTGAVVADKRAKVVGEETIYKAP